MASHASGKGSNFETVDRPLRVDDYGLATTGEVFKILEFIGIGNARIEMPDEQGNPKVVCASLKRVTNLGEEPKLVGTE